MIGKGPPLVSRAALHVPLKFMLRHLVQCSMESGRRWTMKCLVFTVRTNIQATLVMSITRIITSPSITHYHHIPFQQRKQRWFPVPDKCLRSTLSTLTMKQSSQTQEQRILQKTEYWQGCDCVRHRPGWSWRLVLWLWWQQDDIWTMNAVNSRVLQFRNQYSLTFTVLRKGTEANVCPEFYFFPDCPFSLRF